MPAAGAHHQRRGLRCERVALALGTGVTDVAAHRVTQVDLALERVALRGRVRILEVGHVDLRARIERVDDHLAVDRPRDLHAAIGEIGGGGWAPPTAPPATPAGPPGKRAPGPGRVPPPGGP